MSRSYKQNPWITDGVRKSTAISKRFANKKVRNYQKEEDFLIQHNQYKKIFESWEIHDWKSRWTWAEAKKEYFNNFNYYRDKYPTLKLFYRYWSKYYKRK